MLEARGLAWDGQLMGMGGQDYLGLARKQVVLEIPMCPLLSGDIRSLGSDTCFTCSHSQFLAGPPLALSVCLPSPLQSLSWSLMVLCFPIQDIYTLSWLLTSAHTFAIFLDPSRHPVWGCHLFSPRTLTGRIEIAQKYFSYLYSLPICISHTYFRILCCRDVTVLYFFFQVPHFLLRCLMYVFWQCAVCQ